MVSRGWSVFLIGILISSFLGGAIRVFFSPNRIRTWVEEVTSRRQPKFTLEFKEARLALAHGLTPGLAVEFIDLKVQARDKCVTGSEIFIDRLNLPLQSTAVFSSQVKFGVVAAGDIKLTLKEPVCETKLDIPDEVDVATELSGLERAEKFMTERWEREVQNTIDLLDGVSFDKLDVVREKDDAAFVSIKDFEGTIVADDSVAIFDFSVEPGVAIIGHEPIGKLRSHLVLGPESISLKGRGNLKEGQYFTDLNWDVKTGFWGTKIRMQDMPASSLITLLGQWDILSWSDFNPRNQWFRCELQADGNLVSWKESPVRFENCSFYGELGDIQIRPGESRLFDSELKLLTADFRNVDMGPLLTEFASLRQWVLNDGRASGVLTIDKESNLDFNGTWSGAQFQVPQSKFLKIGGIVLDQVDVIWKYKEEGGASLELSNPTAYGQDIPLYMLVNETSDKNKTRISWSANWEEWPKAMLRVTDMVSSQGLQAAGEMELGTESNDIKVKVQAKKLSLVGVNSTNLDSSFKYSEGKGDFNVTASEVSLDKENSGQIISKMLELIPENEMPKSEFRLKGEFDQEGRWVVNPFEFRSLSSQVTRAEFVGRGYKTAVDQGLFRTFKKRKMQKEYNVFGTLEEPRIEVQ